MITIMGIVAEREGITLDGTTAEGKRYGHKPKKNW